MTIATERTVRAAREGDLPAVLRLLEGAGLPTGGVADHFGEGYCVADRDGGVAGVAGVEVHGNWGLLRSVAVAPTVRGSGLGLRLAEDRVRWARRRGLSALYLLTTTAADFFPRLGFVPAAREGVPEPVRCSPEFASLCPASATVMALRLDGTP